MLDYAGKLALAPMVRAGELPTRLLALKYGADLVWGPEIVDKKLIHCKRVSNDCIDFLDPTGRVVFRTHRATEKSKLVFQLGTANADLAVQAASIVAADVDAIDVNSGCPKHFSLHSGMGAALLRTPDTLEAILRALVSKVGEPHQIPISVKIRILETPDETYTLVRRLVQTGIKLLTVHCRTTPMRPRHPVIRDALAGVARICHDAGVACFVNGDVEGRYELDQIMHEYGVDGAMIARAAEINASCFAATSKTDLKSWPEMASEFAEIAYKFDNHYSNTKYCLGRIVSGKDPIYRTVVQAKSGSQLVQILAQYLADAKTRDLSSKIDTPGSSLADLSASDSVKDASKRDRDEVQPPFEPEHKRLLDRSAVSAM